MSDDFEVTPEAQAWFDKENKGLKDQNEQLIGEKRNWKKREKEIENKNTEIMDQMESDEQRRLYESGNVEEAFNRKYHSTISKKDDSIRDLEVQLDSKSAQLERMQIDNIAKQAAIEIGIKSSAVNMVAKSVSDSFKMKDGRLVGYDEAGGELINDKGDLMQIHEVIASLSTGSDYLFNHPGGSGAPGSMSGMSGVKKSDMSREQKSDFVEKHGSAKFLALPS